MFSLSYTKIKILTHNVSAIFLYSCPCCYNAELCEHQRENPQRMIYINKVLQSNNKFKAIVFRISNEKLPKATYKTEIITEWRSLERHLDNNLLTKFSF